MHQKRKDVDLTVRWVGGIIHKSHRGSTTSVRQVYLEEVLSTMLEDHTKRRRTLTRAASNTIDNIGRLCTAEIVATLADLPLNLTKMLDEFCPSMPSHTPVLVPVDPAIDLSKLPGVCPPRIFQRDM